MTKTTLLLVGCALGSACAGSPTIKHCDEILYSRIGNAVEIKATCRVPMDDGGTDSKDFASGIIGLIMGMMTRM